jgi:hypothetical protein
VAVLIPRRRLFPHQRHAAFSTGAEEVRGRWKPMPCAADSNSTARMPAVLSAISASRSAAPVAMLTWSSWLALVGMLSTLRGCREGFVLAGQSGCCDLRDHEAGVQPAFLHQECRQAGEHRVGQQRGAPFGQRADLGNGERDIVGGEGHRLRMEVAAGKHFALRRHQRVVGDGIGFPPQHHGGMAELIDAGAHHLRLAAQAVRVLHTGIARAVAFADGAAVQQATQRGRGLDLPRLAPQRVDARVKRRVGTTRGIDAHGAGGQAGAQQVLRLEQPDNGQCRGDLRAVQQRQSFLRPQRHGGKADTLQRLRASDNGTIRQRLTLANQHQRHMGQRRQIARGTDRALGGDRRQHIGIQQRQQRFHHHGPHGGSAARQGECLQRQDQPHHRRRHESADAGGMAAQQVELQLSPDRHCRYAGWPACRSRY